jgi:hypothetical protein
VKCKTLSTDLDILDVWTTFVVSIERVADRGIREQFERAQRSMPIQPVRLDLPLNPRYFRPTAAHESPLRGSRLAAGA